MSKYKPVTISAAREVAKKYDKNQVIIVTWDKTHGREHVTSYGATLEECGQAARGAQRIQQALHWPPEDIIKIKPSKADLQKQIDEFKRAIRDAYVTACSKEKECKGEHHDLRCLKEIANEYVLKLAGLRPEPCKESSLLAWGQHLLETS